MKPLIKDLMDIKAINVNTNQYFTWASGLKSPIYIDNRLIMSYPELRTKVANSFIELIDENFANQKIDCFFGTATAGIPHATVLAHLLNKPCGYVRGSQKDHGKQNQIEGFYQIGNQVIVVEDLISTGGSVIKVVETLREAGLKVLGVVAIFSYDLSLAKEKFAEIGIPYFTILNFEDLLKTLSEVDRNPVLQFKETLNSRRNKVD